MNFEIITLGCKVNAYESEIMRELLIKDGYKENKEKPDIVIINTCSVTNMADSKSKKMVRRYKRENPNTILVVCGCSSQNNQSVYEEMDIDILLGNRDKSKIVSIINEYKNNKERYIKFYNNRNLDFEDMAVDKFTSHTRAFVKIQDGCNNFCSYCIIPYVRGDIRSKNFDEAINEITELVKNGHKEIVLTGIHTGSYGHGLGYDLTDLIHEISKLENLERIRISSIEITELNDKFLNELKINKKICDHLHIPLQAGSDEILKRMNRKYNLDYFFDKIAKIRKIRPNINISTDVIVGHPYETLELFNTTIDTCKKIKFSKIHVFPYSKRDGTASSRMPNQVEESEKKRRSKELVELSNVLEKEYASIFIGDTLTVLIEENVDNYSVGHTSNFIKLKIPGKLDLNKNYNITVEKSMIDY
ncbi:MAG: tRNA (N(6)-L-threonylcarbamoyladenosine(37)-C(2))-methylthiotransferase MtaB [Firmicutes bacterium]|nr:tRNA (N(6)-L-threonylcarbamoyladenosine(37)-C(2))-methylthiotransferase MtaB [Bacillota bacterium]